MFLEKSKGKMTDSLWAPGRLISTYNVFRDNLEPNTFETVTETLQLALLVSFSDTI